MVEFSLDVSSALGKSKAFPLTLNNTLKLVEMFSDLFVAFLFVAGCHSSLLLHCSPPNSHELLIQADAHFVSPSHSKVLMNLLSSLGKKQFPLNYFFLSWQISKTSRPEQEALYPSARARAWCCCVDHRLILEVRLFTSSALRIQWQFAMFSFSGYVSESLKNSSVVVLV